MTRTQERTRRGVSKTRTQQAGEQVRLQRLLKLRALLSVAPGTTGLSESAQNALAELQPAPARRRSPRLRAGPLASRLSSLRLSSPRPSPSASPKPCA